MPKTDHWRNDHEGPLPYVETEEAFDRIKGAGGVTREQFKQLQQKVEELEGRPVARGQVTKIEFDAFKTDLEKRLAVIEAAVLPPPHA